MPEFSYAARDTQGASQQGTVLAASRFAALTELHARGLTVLAMEEALDARPGKLTLGRVKTGRRPLFGTIKLTEKAVFCRQLSISVNSGIPLREALESIMEDTDNLVFRRLLERVLRRIEEGQTFSGAIQGEEKVFDRLFVALIRSAEESGSMAEILNYLAASLEKSDRLARKIRSIIAYPVFVAGFFVLVSVIMTVFVLPRFQTIFQSYGSNLPRLTLVVFAINRFLVHYGHWVLLGVLVAAALLTAYVRTPDGRLLADAAVLRIPLLGACIRKLSVARFCRNLGIMIRGGVPVTTALGIAAEVLGNKAMEATLKNTYNRIVAGNNIASSLDPRVFPRLVVRMVSVGESSGRLPDVLEKVSDVYEDQVENTILMATALFEPVVIVIFGCIILVMVMAIYLPVFSVAAHAR